MTATVIDLNSRKKATKAARQRKAPQVQPPASAEQFLYELHSVMLGACTAFQNGETEIGERLLTQVRRDGYGRWIALEPDLQAFLEEQDLTDAMFGPKED